MDNAMFFKEFKEQLVLSLNTCYPATVLSFDKSKCEATIQPLFMEKEYGEDPEALEPLEDIPVLQQRYEIARKAINVHIPGGYEDHSKLTFNEPVTLYPSLKKGDKVLCVIAQRSLDDVDSGKPYYPGSARVMNLQDSVIVGVLPW